MTTKIHNISLSKIKPIENLHVSKAFIDRMKKNDKDLDEYDLLLAVEKDQNFDFYHLVGGLDRYYFLVNYTNRKEAPCIIEEESATIGSRNLKLLRRLFNRGDTGKENKQILLNRLSKANIKLAEIIKKTGFTASKIRNEYEFHENVVTQLITDHTAIKTANWIIGLKLKKETEKFLLKRAGLPQEDPQRLTYESMKLINRYLKEDRYRFEHLSPHQQEKVLNQAINFKGVMVKWLKGIVDDYYKDD
ncbi:MULTISPECIES: hypothetical protein [Bacillaceae]|uniref:hypothetical protein n=1 Tax=Bacillaceae TaxID=186817 RepID=UPI000BFE5354|nr:MULTISPECIES: hypothetical protein [Bacillaceae]PGT89028.1 hypothetical protein COD11_04960 [Bacillus sp. AFS040349]UGB30657.1 hypothetical protein LPC09_23660 [Metabacillus sp. B2-18]